MKLNIVILVLLLLAGGCATKTPNTKEVSRTEADNPVSLKAVEAYDAGDYQVSLELYRNLVAQEPENPVYLNNMGVILLKAGHVSEALDAFERASILDPNNVDYLVNIGFAHLKDGDRDDAVSFFDRALQIRPGTARALYGKGVVYLELNEPEIALGMFHRAAALEPGSPENLFMKGYAAQKSSLWEDAIKEYTACIALSQNATQRADAYSNRALCRFQVKEYDKGMEDIGKALEIDDTNAVYYYNRAHGYHMQHLNEKAIKDYTRALSWKSGFPEAYINRGELYYIMGNEPRGCADIGRACEFGYCSPLKKYESMGKCKD